ncbi:MAG TPA: SDR family NAD(P)-dependent oxidoreductase [bacterium]|nr:SDR family NAD(P)-dependent oxidoreductase [bacterium]
MMNAKKKTVLVTGGNRGIGQQVCRELASEGWDVLLAARDPKKGEHAASRLRKETGGRVKSVELDVTSEESIATAARKLKDGAIRIDAIVNNAGVYGEGRGAEGVRRTLQTNFFGPLRVVDGLLPLLNDGARIVNVTSGLGALSGLSRERAAALSDPKLTRERLVAMMTECERDAARGWGNDVYGISKAALNALTAVLARELGARGMKVSSTCPGWVRTDMGGRGAPRSVEEGAASVLYGVRLPDSTPSGRIWRDGAEIAP